MRLLRTRTGTLAVGLLGMAAWVGGPRAIAADWPQWQGPDRNAISKERGLLKEWPKDGPPLAWKIKGLGGGDSTPSIAAGRIFGMSNRGKDEVVWALSEKDGKEALGDAPRAGLQQRKMRPGERRAGLHAHRRRRPALRRGHGRRRGLPAGPRREGPLATQPDRRLRRQRARWSYRESPLVDGDKVIFTPGGTDAMLVALDKLTGKTIWKSQVPGSPGAAYSSAIAIDFEGQRQYVQLTAKGVVGVAASDGKFLWRYDRPANAIGINISTPIYHDGHVFAASAYGAGGGLVKLSRDADGAIKAEEVYFTKKMQNHHGG